MIKEAFDAITCLQIIEEILDRNASSPKDCGAAHLRRIALDKFVKSPGIHHYTPPQLTAYEINN
jgi:hypothetical protein